MLEIEPGNLHWMDNDKPEQDLCVHGGVVIRCSGQVVVDQGSGSWTLSASALYLLRTLSSDHTKDTRVGEHLFPCCGHAMFRCDDSEDVVIVGCNNGYDFSVVHRGDNVQLEFGDGKALVVTDGEWRRAVLAFVDAIEDFYAKSSDKRPAEKHDAEGYAAFCSEKRRRREGV